MSKKCVEFKLTDLPSNVFSVLLRPKIQKNLIEESGRKFGFSGCYTRLARYLREKCKM